eukprot:CAMPEP_0202005398 /NCGR_PEP_ID=MMETSP0905-20130828/10446_1 /ASSEMBLY_ACC=CAM_ASM_000554 /TAXON_ID=420261 /ORGANISM="Thalassiosira antarctica, Strain CCMP982" /LENGTH=50 /DNA_ID=CAMNT_0048562957 /DNA_START=51 /DNA_END=203 /DNA_ORIENTATION=+
MARLEDGQFEDDDFEQETERSLEGSYLAAAGGRQAHGHNCLLVLPGEVRA